MTTEGQKMATEKAPKVRTVVDEDGQHLAVEVFFTRALSKKLNREIPVAVMWSEFEDIDIPDPPYHKSVSSRIVEEYAKDFNPLVAGFLVLNVRESGKVALVDGRHRRLMAMKNGYKGWWFLCTEGLTVAEEAVLFQYFQARKPMKTAERVRALIVSGDQAAIRLRAAVVSSNCNFAFEDDDKRHLITAVEALVWLFGKGGEKAVKRVLSILVHAWMGEPISLTAPLLKGLWIFLDNPEVRTKVDATDLTNMLKTLVPDQLLKRARLMGTEERCGVTFAMAQILRHEYNKGQKGKASRVEFDFAHAPITGRARVANQKYRTDIPKADPMVPAHVAEEVAKRKATDSKYKGKMSKELQDSIIVAIKAGHPSRQICEAFGISTYTIWVVQQKVKAQGKGVKVG